MTTIYKNILLPEFSFILFDIEDINNSISNISNFDFY